MRFRTLLSVGVILLLSSVLALAALDLRFTTAITQSPDPASAGNTVTFTVSFKTFSGAVTNLKITGGIDATQIFTRTYASIAADKVKTNSFNWTATAGSHKAWFVLDPGHTTGDSNYSNNRVEKAFSVAGNLVPQATNKPTMPGVKLPDKNLLASYIKVTDPNAVAIWRHQEHHWIKWETNLSGGLGFFVDLYSADKTTQIQTIVQQNMTTSYYWLVPSTNIGNYRVRVAYFTGRADQFVIGFSEIFEIKPPKVY